MWYAREQLRKIGGASFERRFLSILPEDDQLSAHTVAEYVSYCAAELKVARMRAEDEAGRIIVDAKTALAPQIKEYERVKIVRNS